MLPGQTLTNGVSNFLFGSNLAQEGWATHTARNTPQIQALIKQAGLTLLRCSIVPGNSDAFIDLTAQACSNMGCAMLVILNHSDLGWNQHLVSYLGNRCNLYEFSNEPDLGGISWSEYLSLWNQHIPAMRAINPHAAYIGPVLGVFANLDTYLVPWLAGCKSSGVLPDAISYHIYPCTSGNYTAATCMPRATAFSSAAAKVTAAVTGILGHDIPQALTEWNIDAGNPVASFAKDPGFVPQWTKQAIDNIVQAGLAIACQWDAASNAGGGDDDLISVSNFQPNPSGQYAAMAERIKFYLGGGAPTPVPVPTPTPTPAPVTGSTFYLAAAPSVILPSANQLYATANTGTPPNTWIYNRVGIALGYGELTARGSTGPWAALTSIGAPTGKGFLLDMSLAGQMILSGSWGGNIRLNCAKGGDSASQSGSIIADIIMRAFNYNRTADAYTPIASITLANPTIPANYTTFPLPTKQFLGMGFGPNEYLYLDYWLNVLSNPNNSTVLDVRLNRESTDASGKTGDSNAMVTTPALQPSGVVPTPTPTPIPRTVKAMANAGPFTVMATPTAFAHNLGDVPDVVFTGIATVGNSTVPTAHTCYVDYSSINASTVTLQGDSDGLTVYILSIKF